MGRPRDKYKAELEASRKARRDWYYRKREALNRQLAHQHAMAILKIVNLGNDPAPLEAYILANFKFKK